LLAPYWQIVMYTELDNRKPVSLELVVDGAACKLHHLELGMGVPRA
jgi:hypothetical protein